MYDIIIIGAGPAGITAAVYAARKKLKTLVISPDIGGKAAWSANISNYTGYQFITGPDLAKKFEEHLKSFDVELKDDAVKEIQKKNNHFIVNAGNKEYEGSAVIIGTGRNPKMLNIPGETEFKNKGVTYCATCDAPLFAGKEVAVIGGGNSALDAAIQLIRIAKKVYLLDNMKDFIGDAVMIDKLKNAANIEIMHNVEIKKIEGDKFVKSITIAAKGKEQKISVQGIFIEVGSEPAVIPVKGAELELTKGKEIEINEKCETSVPGIFAAGDCTTVPEKQIVVAAGQGAIASLSAFKYLSTHKFQ